MARANAVIHIKLANPKALRALKAIGQALEECHDAMPWRPELRRAAKAAKYLSKNLKVSQ